MAIPRLRREGLHRGRCTAIALAALLLAAAAAPAQQPEIVSVARLRFEKKCYFQVPEWKGKGESAYLDRLRAQLALYLADKAKAAEVPVLEELLAETLWDRKEMFEADKNLDGADEMASAIGALQSKEPKVEALKIKADDFVVGRNFKKANDALAAGKVDEARQKFINCRNARDAGIKTQVVTALVRIARAEVRYDEALAKSDLDELGGMLTTLQATLQRDLGDAYAASAAHPGVKDVIDRKKELEGSTSKILVTSLDVAGALAAYAAAGYQGTVAEVDLAKVRFALVPAGEGKPFGAPALPIALPKNPLTWYRGTYALRAYLPDEEKPFAIFPARAVKESQAEVAVPNRSPKGMVWVEPRKPGGEGLFVDRYEVTVADVRSVAGEDAKLKQVLKDSDPGDTVPVWFFDEESALAYEKASGKKIPTSDQWLQAAFGSFPPDQLVYPWGKEPPDKDRVFANKGTDAPTAVGGRPAGASPYGVEDMAGNLAEWVRHRGSLWLLGGWFYMGEGGLSTFEGKFPLRDPMPGKAALEGLGTEANNYIKYQYKVGTDGYWSGLRMVLPVPGAK
jgi:sulfatase-modifying factor enzyme 1